MAGSTVSIGVLAVVATLGMGLGAVGAAAVSAARAAATADTAAVAAADTALGFVAGAPCERAEEIVSSAGLALVGCEVDGVSATVTAAVAAGVFRVHARARAGPPPAHSG